MIFILHAPSPKVVQKNILKAWNFNENKLYHRSFDKNVYKFSEQIFLKLRPKRCARQLIGLILKWRETATKYRYPIMFWSMDHDYYYANYFSLYFY